MPSNATAKTKSARSIAHWLVVLIPALIVVLLVGWLIITGKAGRHYESVELKTESGRMYHLEVVDGILAQGEDVPTGAYGLTDDFKNDLRGLPSLVQDRGVLFEFKKEGNRCFSMKGMKFALDIIWINAKRRVVHVERDIPQASPDIFCHENTAFVIKLNAGETKRADIREGQRLTF